MNRVIIVEFTYWCVSDIRMYNGCNKYKTMSACFGVWDKAIVTNLVPVSTFRREHLEIFPSFFMLQCLLEKVKYWDPVNVCCVLWLECRKRCLLLRKSKQKKFPIKFNKVQRRNYQIHSKWYCQCYVPASIIQKIVYRVNGIRWK